MRTPRFAQAALFAVSTAFTLSSQAALITFDELGKGKKTFADAPALTTQYAAQGVTFGGGWEVLHQSSNFGVKAASGSNFLAFNGSVTGISNTLTLSFDHLISDVSGYLGWGGSSQWTITAFNNGAQVAQSLVSNAYNAYARFGLSGVLADKITITSSGLAGVLDNLRFEPVAVPDPASLALLGIGLLALGLSRRRSS